MRAIVDKLASKLEKKTGFPVVLQGVSANLLTGRAGASSAKVTNPAHYPVPDFLDAGELEVRASPSSFLGGGVRLRLVRVHLRSLTGLRLTGGQTNLEEFRRALESPVNADGSLAGTEHRSAGEFVIERLSVRLDAVRTEDHGGGVLVKREYAVAWERDFKDVIDARVIGRMVLEALEQAGLSHRQCPIFATLLPAALWAGLDGV